MGFHMLNNTNIPLIIQTDTIYLSGVENWGLPPFPQYGKLPEALRGTEGHVVILLSHDPSHWRQEVIYHPVALTLAGHTHSDANGNPNRSIPMESLSIHLSGIQRSLQTRSASTLCIPRCRLLGISGTHRATSGDHVNRINK